MNVSTIETPIGELQLISDGQHLVRIAFPGQHQQTANGGTEDSALPRAAEQLKEYFGGHRRRFDLPLAPSGTPFQREVWSHLGQIPYGEVRSYRDIAEAMGKPTAMRAVGAANGRNPLPIVVPCHRVIGADGSLTGFAGGLESKRQLLLLEGYLQL
ncbi:MAG: methylated-DNA--[protein]-cysteine S-methyltransferase [Halieaceae bacterium]